MINLACHVPDLPESEFQREFIFKFVDDTVRTELIEAGITNPDGKCIIEAEWVRHTKISDKSFKEVPCSILASKYSWTFTRAWSYYIAEGPGIPPEKAEEFHKTWGQQVRVNGHCACPSPLEAMKGFAVSSYHIDTQEGLNAFVQLLKSIYIP